MELPSPWMIRVALTMLVEVPPLGLGDSDLAKLLFPGERDRLYRGDLLRQALTAAIESLRPVEQVGPDDARWRPYLIYRGEYIDCKPRRDVRGELGISEAPYTRAKRRGIEWIARYLPYIAVATGKQRAVGA